MFENLWQFQGIDWIATIVTCFATWKIGDKKRSGFTYMIIANLFWIAIAFMASSLAMFIANAVFIIINARALIVWSRDDS